MRQRRVLVTLAVGAGLAFAARSAAAQCPIPETSFLPASTPAEIKVNEPFTIAVADHQPKSDINVCLDGDESLSAAIDPKGTQLNVTIKESEVRPTGPLSSDLHMLRVRFKDQNGAMIAAQRTILGKCPVATPSTTGVAIAPDVPKVGEVIRASIQRPAGARTVLVCFDSTEAISVRPNDVTVEGPETRFSLTIPLSDKRPKGALPQGDHSLTVQLADDSGRITTAGRTLFQRPTLTTVRAIPITEQNRDFVVSLLGSGYDTQTRSNNKIFIEGVQKDVCWDAPCSPNAIRGSVLPREIRLLNVAPAEESRAPFKVCLVDTDQEHCSQAVSDGDAWQAQVVVFLWSLLVTLLVAAFVVFLAWLRRGSVTIWGQRYVVRSLLLDRETDTYSLSKLQFYIWTTVAVFGYAYLTISRNVYQYWVGLPAIPSGLPGIVGIAAGASVGAQVVTQINGPKGAGKVHPSLADLISSGDVVAAERVQFLVWTLIGATGFFLVIAHLDPRVIVDLPPVPESLLAISGISAFGYLGGKLARNAGPVINEVIIRTGPDPEVGTPAAAAAGGGAPVDPAFAQKIADATARITNANQKLLAVTQTTAIQAVVTSAKAAVDAAVAAATKAKLSAAPAAAEIAAARTAVETNFKASQDAAGKAAQALTALKAQPGAADADVKAAGAAAGAADDAAKGAEMLLNTFAPAAAGGGTTTTTSSSGAPFGIIELRGRTLSQDATFKVSILADSGPDDLQVMFDKLEPSPTDEKRIQRPRVVEKDPDAGMDMTLAKRLLLVIRLDKAFEPIFAPKSTHTITVTNPDSQKVAYKFTVP